MISLLLKNLTLIDDLLRRRPWTTQTSAPGRTRALVACVLVFGLLYGAAMGSFGGLVNDRGVQLLYSAIKTPLLLLATFVISLPSFFVLNTLFGLRRDFREAVRALAAAQAGLAVVLASCAAADALLVRLVRRLRLRRALQRADLCPGEFCRAASAPQLLSAADRPQ